MASLATLAEFRTSQPALAAVADAQVQAALDAVSAWARGIVGPVLTADFGTGVTAYVAKIRWSSTFADRFILPTKFATAISKIDGAAYTGALGTDYWLDGEEVTMPSLPTRGSAPYFTVELTGGGTCPADLKLAVVELAAQSVTKDAGREIGSQSLGPRSVTYSPEKTEAALAASASVYKYAPVSA
jgi:hypothetical protein